MTGWTRNIRRATLDNDTFRTVLATGSHLQLVVMSLARPARRSAWRSITTVTSSCASRRGPRW